MNDYFKPFDPPYYAVIFTSILVDKDSAYDEMADRMVQLAKTQKGFLGIESARNDLGITVSYWENLEAIQRWKRHSEHMMAQKFGKTKWYESYKVRIAKVEKEYSFSKLEP